MQPYIKKIASYSMVGSIGAVIMTSLSGCGDDKTALQKPEAPKTESISQAANAEQGFFLVLKQTGANPDTYELQEKHPSSTGTKAIVKDLQGNERILSEAELKKIAEEEAKRVDEGTSNLTKPVATNQGLSLGETILASAAGALIGGMIANKLMGNSNYQQHQQQQNNRAQSTMSSNRTPGANTNNANRSSTSQPRSGFFGGGNTSSSNSSSSSSSSSSSGSAGG